MGQHQGPLEAPHPQTVGHQDYYAAVSTPLKVTQEDCLIDTFFNRPHTECGEGNVFSLSVRKGGGGGRLGTVLSGIVFGMVVGGAKSGGTEGGTCPVPSPGAGHMVPVRCQLWGVPVWYQGREGGMVPVQCQGGGGGGTLTNFFWQIFFLSQRRGTPLSVTQEDFLVK